jgi:hypothetical protein
LLAQAAGADAGGVDGGSDGDAADEVLRGIGTNEGRTFLSWREGRRAWGARSVPRVVWPVQRAWFSLAARPLREPRTT